MASRLTDGWVSAGITSSVACEGAVQFYTVYDDAGRVSQEIYPDGASMVYGYYPNGWPQYQITPKGDTSAITYNNRGQVRTRTDEEGRVSTINYDVLGREIAYISPGGFTTEFGYDLSGNQNVTIDPAGNPLTGNPQVSSTDFFRWDGRATSRRQEDPSKADTNDTIFDAYGLLRSTKTLTSAYGFVGEEGVRQEKGFAPDLVIPYHMRARMYDPLLGRFTSRDPVWDVNLYEYGKGNPWSNIDPLGRQAVNDTALTRADDPNNVWGPILRAHHFEQFLPWDKRIVLEAIRMVNAAGGRVYAHARPEVGAFWLNLFLSEHTAPGVSAAERQQAMEKYNAYLRAHGTPLLDRRTPAQKLQDTETMFEGIGLAPGPIGLAGNFVGMVIAFFRHDTASAIIDGLAVIPVEKYISIVGKAGLKTHFGQLAGSAVSAALEPAARGAGRLADKISGKVLSDPWLIDTLTKVADGEGVTVKFVDRTGKTPAEYVYRDRVILLDELFPPRALRDEYYQAPAGTLALEQQVVDALRDHPEFRHELVHAYSHSEGGAVSVYLYRYSHFARYTEEAMAASLETGDLSAGLRFPFKPGVEPVTGKDLLNPYRLNAGRIVGEPARLAVIPILRHRFVRGRHG